jgi:hypothetical protein
VTPSLAELVEAFRVAVSGDNSLLVVLVVFFGVVLGYISIKVLKYVLSLILVLLLGSLLSMWALSEQVLSMVNSAREIAVGVFSLLLATGLLSVSSFTAGFLLGALVALLEK